MINKALHQAVLVVRLRGIIKLRKLVDLLQFVFVDF